MGEIGRVQCLIFINYINVDRHNEDTGGTTMVLYVLVAFKARGCQ